MAAALNSAASAVLLVRWTWYMGRGGWVPSRFPASFQNVVGWISLEGDGGLRKNGRQFYTAWKDNCRTKIYARRTNVV